MYVKASGHSLRDLKKERGYICCNFLPIREYIYSVRRLSADPENELNSIIVKHTSGEESFGTASIETGMHAILTSRFVLHTHNVYTNVLTCMKGGRDVINELFSSSDFLYIPYQNPGFFLSHSMAKAIKGGTYVPKTIFLENHGLITHHDDAGRALALMLEATKTAKKYLKDRGVFKSFKVSPKAADFSRHLFPDSAVYSKIDLSALTPPKKKVYYEISSAVNYILDIIIRLGQEPSFISQKDVKYIRDMEKEKFRIDLFTGNLDSP